MVDFTQLLSFASVGAKLEYSAQEEEKMRLVRSTLYIDRSLTWKKWSMFLRPETEFSNVPQLYFQNSPILRINVQQESK